MANNNQKIPYKIYLSENEIPASWYNVRADMKNKPAPLLNPGTLQPMTAEELSAVFCEDLVAQELDNEHAYIPIPQEIRDFYKMYRPSPLVRAYCLEEKLQTPAHIYYKFASLTPQFLRPITPRSRASKASRPRPVLASGVQRFPWLVPILTSTAKYTWSKSVMSRSLSAAK